MVKAIKRYIRFLRRQHAHVQHIHALVFASSVTMLIASAILYFDYGFWHEKYDRQEFAKSETGKVGGVKKLESPTSVFTNLVRDGKNIFSGSSTQSFNFLSGKEKFER